MATGKERHRQDAHLERVVVRQKVVLGVVRQGGGAPEVTRDIRGEGGGNVKRQRGGGAMRSGQVRRGNAIRTESIGHTGFMTHAECHRDVVIHWERGLCVPRPQMFIVQVKECIIFITRLLNRSLNAF